MNKFNISLFIQIKRLYVFFYIFFNFFQLITWFFNEWVQ